MLTEKDSSNNVPDADFLGQDLSLLVQQESMSIIFLFAQIYSPQTSLWSSLSEFTKWHPQLLLPC